MSRSNSETLRVYEEYPERYITGTPEKVSDEFKNWIDRALGKLEKGSLIFEIGSSFGRDAHYMESQGYRVQRSDAATSFVDRMNKAGLDAIRFNAISDEWSHGFDMFFANAVLLHFTEEEFVSTLDKAYDALSDGGLFAFSVKVGEGEEWSSHKMDAPRYFKYWTHEQLLEVIEHTDFTLDTLAQVDEDKWAHIILQK